MIRILLITMTNVLFAQQLPQGIGVYGLGMRSYAPQTHSFNDNGERVSLGDRFSHKFDGANLLDGVGGDELAKLARQLKKFDANSNSKNSLLNTLDLGRLQVDVKGSMQAQVAGFGFGISDKLTGFFLVPWTKASVDVDVQYINNNNVNQIRSRLGELAFEDLKSGLDRAAQINTQQILDSLNSMGYADMRHWEHEGVGDIVFGGSYANQVRWSRSLSIVNALNLNLSLPTGYYDDPSVLNDVSIGRGYYVLTGGWAPQFVISRDLSLGLDTSYGYGLPTQVQKRVPKDEETLVAADRETAVDLVPGSDMEYAASVSFTRWMIKPQYKIGIKQHTKDQYSGSTEGNYEALAKGSDTHELYHEAGLMFDTLKSYQSGQFALPVVGILRFHMPIAAKNTLDNRYVEFGIASFFKTPYAKNERLAKASSKKQKSHLAKEKRRPKSKVAHH